MKRSSAVGMFTVWAVLTLTGCGGSAPVDLDLSAMESGVAGSEGEEAQAQVCWVVQEMDGDVSSWAEVDTASDVIRVGYQSGWFGGKDYRGILSFDTSSVPPEAEILGVWMYLGVHPDHLGKLPDHWSRYAARHMVLEVAPPWGFGGHPTAQSQEVTGYDYYAAPMARTRWVQDPAVGAVHLYNRDVNPSEFTQYINRTGVTQIRVGFETNPEAHLFSFQSGEVEANGPEEPYPQPFLYVIWR